MSTDQYNRQSAKYAVVDLGVDNIGTGNGYTAKVPQGALVVSAGLYTVTAFDGTGTVTGTITDGTTALVSAQDVKTTGIETVAVAQKFYATGGTITFSLADANSDSGAGRAIGYVAYVQLGNGCSIQE